MRGGFVPAYAAGGLLLVRHLWRLRPTTWERVRGAGRSIVRDPARRTAVMVFLATRPAVLLAGFLAVAALGVSPEGIGLSASRSLLADLPQRFDTGWYVSIATGGYAWSLDFQRQQNIAFFPAYPLLMRGVGTVLGMTAPHLPGSAVEARAAWAGVIISLASCLLALWYFHRLAEALVGRARAPAAAMLLMSYPFAVFFSAAYTESLYLLGCVAACEHFRREEDGRAFMWGLLVGITRPNGCFLSILLGLLAIERVRRQARVRWRDFVRPLTAASASGVSMLLFTLYLHHLTGIWFAWARVHAAWGRTFQGLEPIDRALEWVGSAGLAAAASAAPYAALNTCGLLMALALVVIVFKRIGFAWGVFVLLSVLPPLFAGGVLSMGRITSTAFPIFLALALAIPERSVGRWTAAFAMGQALIAALFFTWHPLF